MFVVVILIMMAAASESGLLSLLEHAGLEARKEL